MDSSDDQPDVLRVLQSKAETKAFYNKIARFYDLLSERTEQPMREVGLEMLAAAPGEHVLEIGFGTGHCLVKLAEAVGPAGKVYGIDLSEAMVSQALALLQQRGCADLVELLCSDAEDLPYADDSMDAVFLSFTLELFDTPDIPRVLAECRRVLREGGRLVVVALSKEGKQGFAVRAFEWTHRHFPNLLDCRPIYVRRALESAGFHVKQQKLEHMWVPVEIVLAEKKDDRA